MLVKKYLPPLKNISGCGGHLPGGAAGAAGRAVLHGPHLHRDLHHGDGRQVARPRLRQVLHQRLVLA